MKHIYYIFAGSNGEYVGCTDYQGLKNLIKSKATYFHLFTCRMAYVVNDRGKVIDVEKTFPHLFKKQKSQRKLFRYDPVPYSGYELNSIHAFFRKPKIPFKKQLLSQQDIQEINEYANSHTRLSLKNDRLKHYCHFEYSKQRNDTKHYRGHESWKNSKRKHQWKAA